MKVKIADVSELQDGKSRCVKANAVNLVLIKNNGRVFAVENKCPHLGLPLGNGKIVNNEIVCPFHGSRFNIETGENTDWVSSLGGMPLPQWTRGLLAMGKKPQPIKTFKVSIENKDVLVEL